MFAIPLISGLLPIPGLFGATITVPGAGAFLAMMLLAALVGSIFGVLRRAMCPHPGRTAAPPRRVPPPGNRRAAPPHARNVSA
jgi:hypothetical protein